MIDWIIATLLLHFVITEKSADEIFNLFKNQYHKQYQSRKIEKDAYNNFVNNMNKVAALNAKTNNKILVYMLNGYADLNPEEIKEDYGIDIKPYSNALDNQSERNRKHLFIEEMNLYNLNDVANLYKDWMLEQGKKNYTKKFGRQVHYYRFIKTVVETNRKKAEGKNATLGKDADIIHEPDEYFYG